jgi:hypothetical protein
MAVFARGYSVACGKFGRICAARQKADLCGPPAKVSQLIAIVFGLSKAAWVAAYGPKLAFDLRAALEEFAPAQGWETRPILKMSQEPKF